MVKSGIGLTIFLKKNEPSTVKGFACRLDTLPPCHLGDIGLAAEGKIWYLAGLQVGGRK
jgi:hypothetical protein